MISVFLMSSLTSEETLPPLRPSASVGNLTGKRKLGGISKKIAQKLGPSTVLLPVDTVQLHNSRSCNAIGPISEVDSSLVSHFSEVSADDSERSGVAEYPVAHAEVKDSRKRSLSACGIRHVMATNGTSSCDDPGQAPSACRLAVSLDDGKSDDSDTVQSVRSSILPRISSLDAKKGMTKSYLLVRNGKWASMFQDRDELERCFPDGKVTVFVGTWNMAGQNVPSKSLADWLFPDNMHTTADIYAVGIQEAVFNPNGFKEWESKLQRCLWSCKQVLFHSASLGVQHLAIFVRRELIWFLSNGLDPNGRIRDYYRIVQSLNWKSFGWRGSQVLEKTDVVFWAGDLNFRLEEKRKTIEILIDAVCANAGADYTALMQKDQLLRELSAGRLFHKFQEQIVRFPPTYKYDIGTSAFDSSAKNRVPAYTDRILYRVKSNDPSHADEILEAVLYDSVSSIKNSDHKPVFGVFRIKVKPGQDHMLTPKFDTAIFRAGLARDHDDAEKGKALGKSKVCQVM